MLLTPAKISESAYRYIDEDGSSENEHTIPTVKEGKTSVPIAPNPLDALARMSTLTNRDISKENEHIKPSIGDESIYYFPSLRTESIEANRPTRQARDGRMKPIWEMDRITILRLIEQARNPWAGTIAPAQISSRRTRTRSNPEAGLGCSVFLRLDWDVLCEKWIAVAATTVFYRRIDIQPELRIWLRCFTTGSPTTNC